MVTFRNFQRAARVATVCLATGATLALVAAPAWAANTLDVAGASPSAVAVDYTCESSAGVKSIQAMAGDPSAERPAMLGTQSNFTCDDSQHRATIPLTTATGQQALQSGDAVQVRIALMDQSDEVLTGQAKLLTLE